jgi:hypothetical protein
MGDIAQQLGKRGEYVGEKMSEPEFIELKNLLSVVLK